MSSDPNGRSVCIARPHGDLHLRSSQTDSAHTLGGPSHYGERVITGLERRLNMKVLKAWRRTMLSILASMAFLPLAMNSASAFAQDAGAAPMIERGADGLGYYAPGSEPGAAAYGGGYAPGCANCDATPGEM